MGYLCQDYLDLLCLTSFNLVDLKWLISFSAGLLGDRSGKGGDLHDDARRDSRDVRTASDPF